MVFFVGPPPLSKIKLRPFLYILGIVGDIFFKRADLGVASLTLNPSRAAYIGHLQPIGKKNTF